MNGRHIRVILPDSTTAKTFHGNNKREYKMENVIAANFSKVYLSACLNPLTFISIAIV